MSAKKQLQTPGKRNPATVRTEFLALVKDEQKANESAAAIALQLATRAYEVQYHQHWMVYKSKKTGEVFTSFNQWLVEDAGDSRTRIFHNLRVVKFLPISTKEMEKLGKTKCDEISRVAKHSPRKLPKLLEAVRKNPDMSARDVKQLVSNTLAGNSAAAPRRYKYLEFAVPEEDMEAVKEAFEVIQEMDPLEDPENPVSMGRHLQFMCTDWLTTPEAEAIRKKLDEENLPVEIEE